MKASKIVEELKKEFPDISGIREEVDNSIHLGDCAEGGLIDGISACDYYSEDYEETFYVMGVHKELSSFLEKRGYFVECYDPGTYKAYLI